MRLRRYCRSRAGGGGCGLLLAAEPRPPAVFAANVVIAIRVLATAAQLGIRVPVALSVIGLHDMWFADPHPARR